MEETAIEQQEIRQGRGKYRVEMAKVARLSREQQDPTKAEQLADIPPHLLGRY